MKIVSGDLLRAEEKYIVHQCNSMSNCAAGLAALIFNKFPWSNIYSSRSYPYQPTTDELPGNIIVKGNGVDQRYNGT